MKEFEHPRAVHKVFNYTAVGVLGVVGAVVGLIVAYYCIQLYITAHMIDKTYDTAYSASSEDFCYAQLQWLTPQPGFCGGSQ